MIHVLLFSLALQSEAASAVPRAEAAAAQRFCQALTSAEIRAFVPIAANADDLGTDSWSAVRDLFAWYDCISISSCEVRHDSDRLIIELDGEGITRNARRERRPIARRWFLRLDEHQRVVEAKRKEDVVADALLNARDDEARRAIAEDAGGVLPKAALHVSRRAAGRVDVERTYDAALFLLGWSQSNDDPETETYALCTLVYVARARRDTRAANLLAEAAKVAARRVDGCDVSTYADLVSFSPSDDPKRAKALLESVIASADALDNASMAFYALNARAGLDYISGDLNGAFRTIKTLLELARRYGSREGELTALHSEALIRDSIQDKEGTIAVSKRMAMLASAVMNRTFEANSCYLIGKTLVKDTDHPDYPGAIQWLERALRVAPKTTKEVAIWQISLGEALIGGGRVREAEKYLQPALAGARAAVSMPHAYVFAAHLRREQGRFEEAIAFLRKGIAEIGNEQVFLWKLKADLGPLLAECGDVEAGIEATREAIDLIEAQRGAATSNPMIRARYFARKQYVYASLLRMLLDQHRIDEAFVVAEKMKARALDDLLAGDDQPLALTAAEQDEERALNRRIVDLNRKLITATGEAEIETRRALRLARADLERFDVEVALRDARTASHAAVSSDVAASVRKGCVLEYAIHGDAITAFVVRRGEVTARTIGVPRETIERDVQRLVDATAQRDLRYAQTARALYDSLFGPVAELLGNEKNVTIVPDGFLWNVPFDVLIDPAGQFLISRYAFSYAPSVAMLDASARRMASRSAPRHELLAFGDPLIAASTRQTASMTRGLDLGPLQDAEREVRALSRLYGRDRSTTLTGASAREEVLKRLAGDYRIVHLATHGIVDDESPLHSALVLARSFTDADDGLLEMREVRDLHLRADLVVLSACDTARGKVYPGEGVIGLSWAFLTAGCPTAVVSQWKAASRSASQLMIEFHRRLLAGDTKAVALQRAKNSLRNDPAFALPFYWAPFVLLGDGSERLHE